MSWCMLAQGPRRLQYGGGWENLTPEDFLIDPEFQEKKNQAMPFNCRRLLLPAISL